ncbi:MAG: sugar phosphate isomerase/epimerase family protein [Promethearchaeota archaeon]
MAANKLSVITDEIGQDLEEVARLLKPFGVTHVELRKVWGKNIALYTDEELRSLKAILDANGLAVSVVSGPLFKCVLPTSRLNRDRKAPASKRGAGDKPEKRSFTFNANWNVSLEDRIIEIADFLGCDKVRAFSFFKGPKPPKDEVAWPIVVHHIAEFVDKAKARGMTVVVENEGPCFVDTIPNCLRLLEDVDDPHLKLICDPGNFYMAMPKNIYAPRDYDPIIPHTAHVHVKDPKRKIPFFAVFGVVGEGKIDYRGIFKRFVDRGYDGFFSLETHSLRKRREVSLKSLESMAAMLGDL